MIYTAQELIVIRKGAHLLRKYNLELSLTPDSLSNGLPQAFKKKYTQDYFLEALKLQCHPNQQVPRRWQE
jgi:hypothetical protein